MTMKLFKMGITALTWSALLVAGVSQAVPFTFNDIGDTVTVDYGGNIEGEDVDGLTARTKFELTEIDSNKLTFAITITNTSDTSIWENTRIAAIGFNTDPGITNVGTPSDNNWRAVLDGGFPNGFGSIDICFKTGQANNCQGGGGGGVSLGNAPVTFSVDLIFEGSPSSVTFSNFGVRYQSLDSEELGIDGGSGTGTPDSGSSFAEIPEPTGLLLFGAGLIGLGLSRRRKSA